MEVEILEFGIEIENVKVKQSPYRRIQARRAPGG